MAFVETAPVAVAVTDLGLRFMKASPAWLADFGMVESQLIGRTSYDIAPETAAKYGELHRRCLTGESLSSDPERIILPNGRSRWMMWEAGPWRDDDGAVGGLLIISRDVTAQKEAEEEARRSRAFLSSVVANVPAPIIVKDEDGRVLMMNKAMEDLYGVTLESSARLTALELLPAEQGERIAVEDRMVLESGEPLIIEEAEMQTLHQGLRTVHKTKVAIRGEDGKGYILAINQDITERKRTQDELERTRAFLTAIIENVPIPLTVKRAEDGRVVVVNQANLTMMGMAREDFIGKTAFDFFSPEKAAELHAEDLKVIASGRVSVTDDERLQTPHNGIRTVHRIKTGLTTPDGVAYVLTISEDITERKRTQDELERTRAFLATVIENIPVGLTVKDARDGRLLMLNPEVGRIYGVQDGGPKNLGRTSHDVFPSEQAARFERQDREVVESGQMRTFEEPVSTPNGVRHLRRKKVLVRNAEGPDFLLSISEDVTDRELAKDALKEALARAEAANVAKSEFLANMSHEIRTPLNGVLGLADALARLELNPHQRDIVEMIVSSGKALTAILSDVLDLAKAEAGQLELQNEPFSLRETIGGAAYLFETVARDKGVDFKVEFTSGGPDRLVGDALRIRQVVSNLISNAVKFTAAGQVAIHAGVTPMADGQGRLEVTVTDTGPGFTEEVRARLFGRFEQGDGSITRRFGGTGLGLSIAGALAQMMGGEIDCSALPGKGATFSFRVPLALAAAATPAVAPAPRGDEADASPLGLRVLLAEDHEINRKVVQLMLGDVQQLVVTANGQEALDAFLGHDRFDVVLMDSQMPVMDGLTAIRCIRTAEARLGRARTPIVSLTANAMDHQVAAAIDAGADGHLAKPITTVGLHAAIEKAIHAAACDQPADSVSRSA